MIKEENKLILKARKTKEDGGAMGSPLAPTFANLFLCHHEKLWLDNSPSEFKPVLYRR